MEEEKITTEELYGTSDPGALADKPLVYEETPIIEPVVPATVMQGGTPAGKPAAMPPQQPKTLGSFFHTIAAILMFITLFGVGVWLSTFLRQYTQPSPIVPSTPTPTLTQSALPLVSPTTATPSSEWKTYTMAGVSYQLPQDVLAPICDGASCSSQGTYLPGSTRFTVATHNNATQFSSGAVIVDSGGREFTTTETTVVGRRAFSYQGLFTGTTTGGYSFSHMRGVMILVDDTQTLEMNHFTPTGVSADFASDDALFDEILKTLALASGQQ